MTAAGKSTVVAAAALPPPSVRIPASFSFRTAHTEYGTTTVGAVRTPGV
ncbi:hypothetical protein [Streptomyces sp. ML-6]|nr:hypothetical protein [Streptomyces sp. ML-6]MDK0518869.1 hypothetical protein [Streptomyces sp. ML-6]